MVSCQLSSPQFSVRDDYSGAMHASNAFSDKPTSHHVHLNAHDPQTEIRTISLVLEQEKPEDWSATEPGNVRESRSR